MGMSKEAREKAAETRRKKRENRTVVPLGDVWRLIAIDDLNWCLQRRSEEAAAAGDDEAWQNEGYYGKLEDAVSGAARHMSEDALKKMGDVSLLELADQVSASIQVIEDAVAEATYMARR